MITIVTSEYGRPVRKGRYEGRKVDSIIRREYGRKAFLRHSRDPNDPNVGMVLTPARANQNANLVLATVHHILDSADR